MANTIQARDLYVRITDKNGKSVFDCRRVWNEDLYISINRELLKKEGSTLVKISKDEYDNSRGAQ